MVFLRSLSLSCLLFLVTTLALAAELSVVNLLERDIDGRNHVCLRFSEPLDTGRDIQSYFSISREGGEVAEGAWLFSGGDRLACFSNSQPATEYVVTVYRGLPAKNGAKLQRDVSDKITTRSLSPVASFGSRGSVLLPGISAGLPVVSVNVPAVDVTFHRVRPPYRQQVLDELASSYYYTLLRQLPKWTELAYSGRFDLGAEQNRRVKRTLPTADIEALRQPGLYIAVMKPAGTYPAMPQLTHFMVTDLGLHLRHYGDRLDVHVSSLTNPRPLAGVEVSLLDDKGQILQQARTSPDGVATFRPSPKEAVLLLAEQGANQSLLRLNGPALDLSGFDPGERPQAAQTLFLWSERDIYRPGERFHFNALLRDGDGRLKGAPGLQARLLQPDGQVVRRFVLTAADGGYYQRTVPLPATGATGGWRLEVDKPDGKVASYPFQVEEFLPERMKLTFAGGSDARKVLMPAAALMVSVKGDYLYGAPASGNRLTTLLRVDHWREPVEALPGFEFGDVLDDELLGTRELPEIFLDEAGRGVIESENFWREARSPLRLRLVSSLYESGGRPVTRRYDLLVWPGDPLVGIRPGFDKGKNPPENSRVSFDLVRATLDGRRLAGELEVTLIREERQYFWEYVEPGGWQSRHTDEEYPVATRSVTVAAGGQARVELPVKWGRYRLEVIDSATGRKSSLRFTAGADWEAGREAGGLRNRPDAVGLTLDKPAYRGGDTARLTIDPPHDGEALILVEGDRPLWRHRQPVSKAGTEVSIPVDPAWRRHDLHVSVVVLRPASKVASITPTRAFGLIHLPLDRSDRRLELDIDAPDKAEPGKPLPVTLRLQRKPAAGQRVFVTVAAVDTGVLSLTDFATPDPHEGFFGRRRYGVEARDNYGELIELNRYPRAGLRFGGDGPGRGGKAPAAEVQIVSLHSGPLTFDANGEARLDFDIPHFNGRLRLMAVAFADDAFGHADREVTIAAPVVAQMAMPRFLASGDDTALALDLRNLSGKVQALRLALRADGPLTLREGAEQEITLADGERRTLRFPVRGGEGAGVARLTLTASGDGIAFERHWSLMLRPPWPRERQRQLVAVEAGRRADFDLGLLQRLQPASVVASLHVDDHIDLGAGQQMAALLQYPYGCLEQVSSRSYPWLFATPEALQRLGLESVEPGKRVERVEEGLRQIEAMQLASGGFGLWNNRSPEEHWLTAYVADLLLDAEEAGFPVQPELKRRTFERLETYLRQPRMSFGRYTDSADHYRFAYRAYAAWVLSRVNRANLGQMRSLFDHEADAARSGLPLVHLGLALRRQGDRRRGDEAIRRGLALSRDDDAYLGDYGSTIRDDAMIVRLLAGEPAHAGAVAEKLRGLAGMVAGQEYLSTQERNALFLAAVAGRQQGGGRWRARVHRAGDVTEIHRQTPFDARYGREALRDGLGIENPGDRLLWASLTLSGYPAAAPSPAANGYEIERHYFDREGRPLDIRKLRSGDLVLVHLAIDSERRMADTLVVDMLPAGLELENQNLEHSLRLDRFWIEGKPISELQSETDIVHQEFRDDRYVAAIDHGRYGQRSHLFYLARAVTPGRYRVPPPLVEDMYRPRFRAVGGTVEEMVVEE